MPSVESFGFLPAIFALSKDIGWRLANLNKINNLVPQIFSTGWREETRAKANCALSASPNSRHYRT
jgi:hypothetical protein